MLAQRDLGSMRRKSEIGMLGVKLFCSWTMLMLSLPQNNTMYKWPPFDLVLTARFAETLCHPRNKRIGHKYFGQNTFRVNDDKVQAASAAVRVTGHHDPPMTRHISSVLPAASWATTGVNARTRRSP